MAEPLKNRYGPEIPRQIAQMVAGVHPAFPAEVFLHDASQGYEPLDLMARARHMSTVLRRHLPQDYSQAAEILIASLGPVLERTEGMGMAPFVYLPHVFFVADYGLEHFELSMRAQHALTQRFTAEFSLRPYLVQHREATLKKLEVWTQDSSKHVRRLVSEGTRPRLPWAPRLREFQADPRPVLRLLELLKDDPSLYVRRSVANNLNDIGKDHPQLLADTAGRWLKGASPQRQWVVRHALRSAVKRGEAGALEALGFGGQVDVALANVMVEPQRVSEGGRVSISLEILNTGSQSQDVLVDLRVFYVKANGKANPKVFKLKTLHLAPQAGVVLSKTISLAAMTTRRHYPGLHRVEVLLNGRPVRLGGFEFIG
jgi:3-methyladenine DNA glycosylase AlkC